MTGFLYSRRPVSLLVTTTVIPFPSGATLSFTTSMTLPPRLSVPSIVRSLTRRRVTKLKRYADLFSDEEPRSNQRKAQWEGALQAPAAPIVGEGAAQDRDSARVQ